MDATDRMQKVAASSTIPLLDFFHWSLHSPTHPLLGLLLPPSHIPVLRWHHELAPCLTNFVGITYLVHVEPPQLAVISNRTRPVYEFVRLTLGIRMHGSENYHRFVNGLVWTMSLSGKIYHWIHEVRLL